MFLFQLIPSAVVFVAVLVLLLALLQRVQDALNQAVHLLV